MKQIYQYWYLLPPFLGMLVILLHDKLTNFIQQNLTGFPCLFHALTGLYCPFCGGTRSTMELLQGHLTESLRKNPLVIFICMILILSYLQAVTKKRLLPKQHKFWIICAGIFFLWCIVRNFVPFLRP